MPQEDASVAVHQVHLLHHDTALVTHVDRGALAIGDHRLGQVHARFLHADDAVLPAVLQLAALEKGLAFACCDERVLPASDDRLPQGSAGGLVLLQARVAHLSLGPITQQAAVSRVTGVGSSRASIVLTRGLYKDSA